MGTPAYLIRGEMLTLEELYHKREANIVEINNAGFLTMLMHGLLDRVIVS